LQPTERLESSVSITAMSQALPVHQVLQVQVQVRQVLQAHQVLQSYNLCPRPMYPISLRHRHHLHHLRPHLHLHLPHLHLPHLRPHQVLQSWNLRPHPICLRHRHHLHPLRPHLRLPHLHPHRPLHHLHQASTTTHHCRSPLGRTQAQVQALECRNGALHRARLPSTWNGRQLLLQPLNLPPLR